MSSHLKDQQQQQKAEPKQELSADQLFNEHLIKTVAYTGIGFGFGMLSSLFFKHRAGMTMFFAGTGAGYGASSFLDDLNHYQKFKSYSQQQPQVLKREAQIAAQDWKQYMPKEQSAFQQKNYQRGGSDNDDDDDKKEKESTDEDERDLTYSQKLAEEAARQLSKIQKPSQKDDKSQKASDNKKQDVNKKEASSKSQEQAKPQQQDSKKEQARGQNQTKTQQKQEHKKEQAKDQDQAKPQQKQNQSDKQQGQDNKQENIKKPSPSKETPKEIGEKSQQVGASTFLKVEGQQFMDFKSNTVDAGKPAPGEKNLLYRGSYRSTKGSDEDLVKGAEQDRLGRSARTGNKMKLEDPDHSKAGSQFSGDNLSAKSQVNAVIE